MQSSGISLIQVYQFFAFSFSFVSSISVINRKFVIMKNILKHIIVGLIFAISSCQADLDYKNIKVLPNQGIEIEGKLFQLDKNNLQNIID